MTTHLLSIDLEDWFHILDYPPTERPEQWLQFPSRIHNNTDRLLDLFDQYEVKATFFVLGWVAEKYPELVRRVEDKGHQIGSHSYAHPLIYKLTPAEFEADLELSMNLIQQVTGKPIEIYRAPGFSITAECLWAFDILASKGIKYDSSVFPSERAHGGLPDFPNAPFQLQTGNGTLTEYPISTTRIFSKDIVFDWYPTSLISGDILAIPRISTP